jgi:hypothetical protein
VTEISRLFNDKLPANNVDSEIKVYVKPSIIYELNLETRAGTPLGPVGGPLGPVNPLDPLGTNSNNTTR